MIWYDRLGYDINHCGEYHCLLNRFEVLVVVVPLLDEHREVFQLEYRQRKVSLSYFAGTPETLNFNVSV